MNEKDRLELAPSTFVWQTGLSSSVTFPFNNFNLVMKNVDIDLLLLPLKKTC